MTSADGLAYLGLQERQSVLSVPDGSFLLDPAISADGKTYAYVRQPPAVRAASGAVDYGSDLMLIDSNGKNEREVVHHAKTGEFVRYPIFLPDENAMLVGVRGQTTSGFPDFRIERIEVSNGAHSRLIENATAPALAPDGRTLAYAAFDPATQLEHLVSEDLKTHQKHNLVPPGGSLVLIQGLAWSPDGKILAFMSSDLSTGMASPHGVTSFGAPLPSATHPTLQDLWLVNADGSNLHRLVELAEPAPSAAWSADGSELYVMAGGGFWRVDPQTGDRVLLGEGVLGGQIARLP